MEDTESEFIIHLRRNWLYEKCLNVEHGLNTAIYMSVLTTDIFIPLKILIDIIIVKNNFHGKLFS